MSSETKAEVILLVELIRAGLDPLVRDGLIEERRATERAPNIASIILGHFDLKAIKDDDV